MEVITVGLDLAKRVFQVHGVDAAGGIVIRKALRRGKCCRSSPSCRRASSAWKRAARHTIGHAS